MTRVDQAGVAAAAKQLGLHESQLYGWRQQVEKKQQRHSVEHLQAAEIARLKRTLFDQSEDLTIPTVRQRTSRSATSEVRLHV